MTHFHFEFDATCPSNWTEEDARAWVSKLLCVEEIQTLKVYPLDKPTTRNLVSTQLKREGRKSRDR